MQDTSTHAALSFRKHIGPGGKFPIIVPSTWDNGRVPNADPQNRLYPSFPHSTHLFAPHQRSSTSHQLRTTKPSYPHNRRTFPSASTDTSKGNKRKSHNLVEKQYHTRLNGLFTTLLSAIPNDVIAADINGYTTGDGSPGKALEKREVSLEGEQEILIEKIQRLERELAKPMEVQP